VNKSRCLYLVLLLSVSTFADNSEFLQETQIPEVNYSIALGSIGTRDFETIDFGALESLIGGKAAKTSRLEYICRKNGESYLYVFETPVSSGYYASNDPLSNYPLCHEGRTELPFSRILYPGQTKSEVELALEVGEIMGSVEINYSGPVHDVNCNQSYYAYESLYLEFEKSVLKRAYYVLAREPLVNARKCITSKSCRSTSAAETFVTAPCAFTTAPYLGATC
jgi:hypothetical protein